MNARVRAVLFTAALTAAFVSPVALVHLLTEARVDLNKQVFLKRAVLVASGIAAPSSPREAVALYDERVDEAGAGPGGEAMYRVAPAEGSGGRGYVIVSRGAGLWGRIVALVGFAPDRTTLTGLAFLEQSETPGLGARIDEPWFKDQFRGKKGPFATVPEGSAAGESQFDAVSGATFTSEAVRDILNAAAAGVAALGD
jgi:Na+-transporting NADH:ubiquinone oxidoreductase subunit C